MQYRYFAYGLKIDSAIELPELGAHCAFSDEPDLWIRFGEVKHRRSGDRKGRNISDWPDLGHFWFRSDGGAHFAVRDGREITVMLDPGADLAGMRVYLLGSVCGAMLLQRGFLVLHGNAVRIGDACLVCVGESGVGKSTLAAAFLKRGFDVLADDVVAVDAAGRAAPSFPRMKLWQDAADQLGFSTEGLPEIMPGMSKYNFPITAAKAGVRLPVRWVYELNPSDTATGVEIEHIAGMRRFTHLLENTYRNEYLHGAMLSAHLQQCSRLAATVRLARVTRPRADFSANQLVDRLLADVGHGAAGSGREDAASIDAVDKTDETRRHHSI